MSGYYDRGYGVRNYRCTSAHHQATREHRCWHAVRADWLEDHIWSVIEGNLLSQPEYLARELERRRSEITGKQAVQTNDVLLVGGKLATLDQRLKHWQEAYADASINLAEFRELKAGIDQERRALERVKSELQAHLDRASRVQQDIEAAVAFVQRVNDELPTYSLPEQRRVLEALGLRAFYWNRTTIRLKFWIPAEVGIDPADVFDWPEPPEAARPTPEDSQVTMVSTVPCGGV
jgi:hypothetical protein